MREERVLALAGVFQAIALARAVALRGSADATEVQTSLASVFKIDSETPADVFGGIGGVRSGLQTMIAHLEEQGRDLAMTRMLIAALRLERSLAKRRDMLDALRSGIEAVAQRHERDAAFANETAKLGQLYVETLSRLRPRIVVEGNPTYLKQAAQVDLIRSLLLAAIRAAVLWRQLGGSQLRLLFRRRQYTMLARGLLTRCTLAGT